jgi:hypothetical protein
MRWTLVIAAWLAAAALATAASIGAVSSLRGLFGPSDAPLREADVEARLTPVPATPSASPAPTPAPPPSAAAETTRALVTAGGSLVATCTDGLARLDSWIPRSGYETDHEVQGPAAVVSLRFKARSGGGSVRAQVTCRDGEPTLTVVDHD